jgi:hypothetical protein
MGTRFVRGQPNKKRTISQDVLLVCCNQLLISAELSLRGLSASYRGYVRNTLQNYTTRVN